MDTNKIIKLKEVIEKSNNIVFFGGAGVSTDSGIPDFRGANGLYHYSPEEIVSHSFFEKKTKEFFDFYFKNMVYKDAKPNLCHYYLAELERKGKLKAIITQNIDGLHQKAGSKNVFELHGSVMRNRCEKCNKFYSLDDLNLINGIPRCTCGGIVKPDVVLYEEQLDNNLLIKSINTVASCDTLIVAGTSLVVYPAAGIITYFKGTNLVLINKQETQYDYLATLVFHESIDDVIRLIKE